MKVLKFGGTSMASAATVSVVKDIVLSSKSNLFVVVSAPGKRKSSDTKVTDLLYSCHYARIEGRDYKEIFSEVKRRFCEIAFGLKLNEKKNFDLNGEFYKIERDIENGASRDYVASRGEYLSAFVTAAVLDRPFVDAAEIIRFDENGKFDEKTTEKLCVEKLDTKAGAVCPGFYGSSSSGTIKTFTRGGSDVTGAIIAGALNAEVYENFTDVDGFMTGDPRVIDNPRVIDVITYRELRELSYMGADVLHSESIFPVRKRNIPIRIRNTFSPNSLGTDIVPSQWLLSGKVSRKDVSVTGIAGKKGFFSVQVEKSMMNNEKGFARKLLSVVEDADLSLEHMPSGIDTVSLVIDGSGVEKSRIDGMLKEIRRVAEPDRIEVIDDIALIAVVGHGMVGSRSVIADMTDALKNVGINICMIDRGSSGLNVIIAVSNDDFEPAMRAIHSRFFS